MAKKSKGIKADFYEEPKEVENEIEDIEEEVAYDIDIEEPIEEIKPKKAKAKKKSASKNTTSLDVEEYEETSESLSHEKTNRFMKIFNIVFVLALVIMVIISIDVICVAKYNVGPFFAIKTSTYKDGGTKVYYGLGYKVIKYNQLEGRRDTQIGFWSLPYITTPTEIQDIDLAIEFQNKPEATGKKYYKQYLKISSTIKSIDKENNELTLEYTDPDGKYTLQIICPLASEKDAIIDYTEQEEVIVKGTVYKFSLKDDNQPNTAYLSDCFVEKAEASAE